MTCLNCCDLPPESTNKLRYVYYALYSTCHITINTPHPPTPTRPQAVPYYCSVCDDRISQWMGPNERPAEKWSAPVHIKICWRPTWDLHYVHLAALGFHRLALVNTAQGYCPALVLTLCWQRHKWELTLGIERGIFHFTYAHREMCWGCGNVYIRLSDVFSVGALMRTGGRSLFKRIAH